MNKVNRIYTEKRKEYAVTKNEVLNNLKTQLKLTNLKDLRVLNRYDISGVSIDNLKEGINTILCEPMVDDYFVEDFKVNENDKVIAIEYLPGQYDQRSDACEQCFTILTGSNNVKVRCATIYVLIGDLSNEDINNIKHFLINPVDQHEATLQKYESLENSEVKIEKIKEITNFINFNEEELKEFLNSKSLAMNLDDLKLTQDYFKNEEKRNPTETEILVLDTYWSDHCRHTTFSTIIKDINIDDGEFKEILRSDINNYINSRHLVYGLNTTRPLTLMDLATIGMKELRKKGYLDDLEVSEEINACSIEIKVNTNKGEEDWLLMFKNETHNHPTEIEPFGGAATCLGGAIRDPLSGRAYVYQSMRITGSGDPRKNMDETIKGKLPQRKICLDAARGFSSYGNQIGLTTGYVHEIYDEGYIAKRMEVGAVVAAAPKDQVKRLEPKENDIVLLIGGRTGRDGIGGATGSSKSHEEKTTLVSGAEVQKGNAVEERKIQRLFRNKEVSKRIIRCNDFGAGGVSVAVGELARGLDITLDNVLKKYEGLNGSELAISESQERMAIVINKDDEEFIKKECQKENLEVVKVATVTNKNRLVMDYMGQRIVDISRDFLDQNGAKRYCDVSISLPDFTKNPFINEKDDDFVNLSKDILTKLSVCSQKGLVERFDSSIGNGTVLSPYGGKYFRTETEGMCALIPTLNKETTTCSIMSYGYNPLISSWSPYHGAMYAVMESVAKIVAMGGDYHNIRLSFQEYFEKLGNDAYKWGKPFASLLGAYKVCNALNIPSIGGKDSMSGTFMDISVPPTLISFAIVANDVNNVISPEIKDNNSTLVEIMLKKDKYHLFDFDNVKASYDEIIRLNKEGKIRSAYTIKDGGVIEAIYKMSFGNNIGVKLNEENSLESLTNKDYGNIIIEVKDVNDVKLDNKRIIGYTNNNDVISYKDQKLSLNEAYSLYNNVLDNVYPLTSKEEKVIINKNDYISDVKYHAKKHYDEVKVTIPVFPGTNCEYDSRRAFINAGAKVNLVLIRNKTIQDINDSIDELVESIKNSQIIMFPGGFSAGDEPDGSGKFIATFLRNDKIKEAIDDFLNNREGLMIGICNGFQALIKLGLLPYGYIKEMDKNDATLTFNKINRHVSQMVNTRICSNASPWLSNVNVGSVYTIPVSHGEGRFVAPTALINELFENGQVFSQYVDFDGNITMESPFNPNGSMMAIEGILSKDGHILGKMGHSERVGENRNKNIYGEMDQLIFESGVKFFK